jgi:DNA-directed RNA polymerase subunit RPC12/RpoP
VKKCHYCGNEGAEASTHCLRCGTEFTSAETAASEVTKPGCPQCGSLKNQPAISLQSSVNPLAMHFGGLIVSTLFSASRQQRMRCLDCGKFYLTTTKSSRVALIVLVIVLGLIALSIVLDLTR